MIRRSEYLSCRRRKGRHLIAALLGMALIFTACGSDGETDGDSASTNADTPSSADTDTADIDTDTDAVEEAVGDEADDATSTSLDDFDPDDPVALEATELVRLITHDSFTVPDNMFDRFTIDTGVDVQVIKAGDAGELVARSILTAGQPEADVLFGVDNTFLQRALDNDLFLAYESPMLASVADELELDPEHRVTPIDFGDVCVNYWTDALDGDVPTSIAQLVDPSYAASFVTEDPEASSPGFAFLLATIGLFGEDGWEDYWTQLADGGVAVTSGWSDAYYGEFVSGGGPRALVTSYAASPVAEYIFATEDIDAPPTGVITDGCFRQIEFAGILNGTDHPEAAAKLVDFLLSAEFQAEIPLNMFVNPANGEVELPATYRQWAAEVTEPITMDPASIEANRNRWTERWAEIVLR